jgi:hypothetical protein
MKKILLSLAVCFCAAMSAQAQDFRLGGRLGAGLQAQAEYGLSDGNYVEGRFGMGFLDGGVAADFSALHMWNIMTMDWTPSAGQWFFDAGAGVNVGGVVNYAYVGVCGSAKLGIQFNDVPLRVAIDWSPTLGPAIEYYKGYTDADFRGVGLANVCVSAVYCF